jgi:tRNA threonylcarbamoyladenosine biosynthesis protein TsaE
MGAVTERVELELPSLRATRELGGRIAAALAPGDFVGLEGELGAGKTFLARAICTALGVPEDRIASPTFAIVHPYEGGRIPLHHADLYRISDLDELYETGFLDLVGRESALVVEWIDRVPEAAPAEWLRVRLLHAGPRRRRAVLEGHGARGVALLRAARGGVE